MSGSAAADSYPRNRQAFYERLGPHGLGPLWENLKGLVPRQPKSAARPHVWRYDVVRPLLLEAGDVVTAEEAERRVLMLENPGMPGQSRITSSMYAGIQLIMPGETARTHRHSTSALRVVLESEGGFTTVAGERLRMERGDFLITPNWAYHDHGNDGDTPVIWVDGLDIPLVNFLDTGFSEHPEEKQQRPGHAGSVWRPRTELNLEPLRPGSSSGTSPRFSFPYRQTREALLDFAAAEDPDPHTGAALRYAGAGGGWAMQTMSAWLTHFVKGFETKPMRSTDGQIFVVLEGEVEAKFGEETLKAGPNDVLAAPAWVWRQFRAARDSVVFAFSDRSTQEKLGLWREERQ